MVSGTVLKWYNRKKDGTGPKYSYGFAVTPKGQTLEGKNMRLQVGAKVNFTIEEVSGHDGRVLGKGVSGPGVVSWDDWKESGAEGKAMALKAKEQWQEHKEAQS
eukprot:gene3270-3718_t